MTLIVAFISEEFVALVSDRRITWQIGGAARSWEDTENKAIVLAGTVLMGFTGFARLGGIPTDRWVVENLVNVEPSEYLRVLAERAERAVQAMGSPLESSGHAFVAVGYPSVLAEPTNRVPRMWTISNALEGGYGTWRPTREFHVATARTPASSDFLWGPFGALAHENETRETDDLIRRYRRRYPTRTLGVLQLLVSFARRIAARDEGVSPDVSVSVLPRAGISTSAPLVVLPLASGLRDSITSLTCMFVLADRDVEQAEVYGPATVMPGIATQGFEAWTRNPPWWTD